MKKRQKVTSLFSDEKNELGSCKFEKKTPNSGKKGQIIL